MLLNKRVSEKGVRISQEYLNVSKILEFVKYDDISFDGPETEESFLFIFSEDNLYEYSSSNNSRYFLEKVWSLTDFKKSIFYSNCFERDYHHLF